MEQPDSPPFVPYQAYRSKRHTRTSSNPNLSPNGTPSRPSSIVTSPVLAPAVHAPVELNGTLHKAHETLPKSPPIPSITLDPTATSTGSPTPPASPPTAEPIIEAPAPRRPIAPPAERIPTVAESPTETQPSPAPPSTSVPKPAPLPTRKSSTFRHVPLRTARSPLPSSPLRPGAATHSRTGSASSLSRLVFDPPQRPDAHTRVTSFSSIASTSAIPELALAAPTTPASPPPAITPPAPAPPTRTASLAPQQHPPAPPLSTASSASSAAPAAATRPPSRGAAPAPYRAGFQPRGVYRPRTDEFAAARRTARDVGRVERTKLERRLEKLVALHFPPPAAGAEAAGAAATTEKARKGKARGAVVPPPPAPRRASSFFDLDLAELKNMDAGGLWRGVLMQAQGAKGDVRAAEQRITPWQDDATVSKCPLCTASFHPLTNRKHHCRLCGQIICSLPVKRPLRPVVCSLLFVVDPKTRRIEEVGEGVDYGVRRRRVSNVGGAEEEGAEEKFLKGVRICRECRPVLARQQYLQEVVHVPTFVKLYEAFIALEKEIEDSIPQFQELLLSLTHEDQPTREASAARKRLLEAFAQYDALAKRIRRLPAPAGGSQDRVQTAVAVRANVFLQKHMFPLQSLPTPKRSGTGASSPAPAAAAPAAAPLLDPDSAVAHALQPLLEQEALLESFVEEATAHRKFEDARTLKASLAEIRAEIERVVANAERGMGAEGAAPRGR